MTGTEIRIANPRPRLPGNQYPSSVGSYSISTTMFGPREDDPAEPLVEGARANGVRAVVEGNERLARREDPGRGRLTDQVVDLGPLHAHFDFRERAAGRDVCRRLLGGLLASWREPLSWSRFQPTRWSCTRTPPPRESTMQTERHCASYPPPSKVFRSPIPAPNPCAAFFIGTPSENVVK